MTSFSPASLVWMLLALGCGRTPLLPTHDAAQTEPVQVARDAAPDLGQDRARDTPPDAHGDLAANNSPAPDARATPDMAREAARDATLDADAIDARDARIRACAWGGLSALETYPEGSPSSMHPTRVAVGDFNHDGHLDFAATDQNQTVSVFVNHGDGGFAQQVLYVGTPWANQVATGDFNGDGYVDIAVADGRPSCGGQCCSNGCDGEVAVLINRGDGTFASPAYYDSGGNFASGLAVGDLNGDDHPDFVVTNYNANTLAVLLNRGDGTLAAPVTYPASNPDTIALADLDGDGALDVVVGLRSLQPSSIKTFFNDGTGALTAGATYNSGLTSSGLATATSIVSGDFEGTGHTDLIVGDTTGDHLFLYANPGNGVFGTPATIDAGGRPGSLVAADFNGDGKLDIATGLRIAPDGGDVVEEAAVLMGDGRGGFSQPILYPDDMPSDVAAGDFNGDGYPDLLTGNSSWVSVLSSQCGGDAGAGYDSQDAGVDTREATGSCGEPTSCEGYDSGADASVAAVITCLSPDHAAANAPLSLAIYGHHLATGSNDYALVVIGNATLNGMPVTACHINVDVPAYAIPTPGQVPVVVSPGGWIRSSAPVSLTLR